MPINAKYAPLLKWEGKIKALWLSLSSWAFLTFLNSKGRLFGIFLIFCLLTLIGNAIIIVVICLEESLHVPMYLFLQNLSVVDVSISAVIMPEMLVVLSNEKTSISFVSCFAQKYFILFFFWWDWMFSPRGNGLWPICCNLLSSELPSDYEQTGFYEISYRLMDFGLHVRYCTNNMGFQFSLLWPQWN